MTVEVMKKNVQPEVQSSNGYADDDDMKLVLDDRVRATRYLSDPDSSKCIAKGTEGTVVKLYQKSHSIKVEFIAEGDRTINRKISAKHVVKFGGTTKSEPVESSDASIHRDSEPSGIGQLHGSDEPSVPFETEDVGSDEPSVPETEDVGSTVVGVVPMKEENLEPVQTDNVSMQTLSVPKRDANSEYLEVIKVGEKNFGVLEEIGQGGQAVVYRAEEIVGSGKGKVVALKVIWKNLNETQNESRMEIDTLSKLGNNANIIRLQGYDLNTTAKNKKESRDECPCTVLVQEYARCGELFDYIQFTGAFEMNEATYAIKRILCGVLHMHENGYCHRDLKPENILMDKRFQIKIADLGFVADSKNPMKTTLGTKGYMAPEINSERAYSSTVDVFAAGVILFVMLAACPPFRETNTEDWWFCKLSEGSYDLFWAAHERRKEFSPVAKDLIENMLHTDPNQRFTVPQCLEHEFFNSPIMTEKSWQKCMHTKYKEVKVCRVNVK